MLLWPFNKYPGTDYETFNWEWILKTVKDWVAKMTDFVSDMTDEWNTFKNIINHEWDTFKNIINHEIAEMHRKFAIYVNVTEEALNTGAIADGAITKPKINATFLPEIENAYVRPEEFGAVGDGVTDDTSAIISAINTGKVVAGTRGKTYAITGFSDAETVSMISCHLKFIGNAGYRCFVFDDATTDIYLHLEDCVFDGDNKCFRFFTCEDDTKLIDQIIINNCEFKNIQHQAVYFPLAGNIAIVTNSYFHDLGNRTTESASGGCRIGYTSDAAGTDNKVDFIACSHNKFENIKQTPQQSSGDNANAIDISGKYCVVTDNYFSTIDAQAIYIKSLYCEVTGNYIEKAGIYSNGPVAIKNTDYGVFSNNQIHVDGCLGLLRADTELIVSDCQFNTTNTAQHSAPYAADDYLFGYDNVIFNGCTFNVESGELDKGFVCYYGDAEFNNCDFDGYIGFYNSSSLAGKGNFEFNNCTINTTIEDTKTLVDEIAQQAAYVIFNGCTINTPGFIKNPRRKVYAKNSLIQCKHVDNKVSATYGTAFEEYDDCKLVLSGNQTLSSGDIQYHNCDVTITGGGSIYNSRNVKCDNTVFNIDSDAALIRYTNTYDTTPVELEFVDCICKGAVRLDGSASGHTYAKCIIIGCVLPTTAMATGSTGTVYEVRDNIQANI